jgi:hypothetical protein
LTHYDPVWYAKKAKEKPFDLGTAKRIVAALADEGFNTLLIGVSDGVVYRKHPELRRSYSRPADELAELAAWARKHRMTVIPKLNFSRSEINTHNHWMRRKGQPWYEEFEDPAYWKKAFDCIDEVIRICKPERYLHVGMDEDHDRSLGQYVSALRTLRAGLKERKLRMIAWSDSAVDYASGELYREKSRRAEAELPHDTVRLLWNYWSVPRNDIRAIRKQGHELWCAPGWNDRKQAEGFRDAARDNGATGIVMTRWIACRPENEKTLLAQIRSYGPVFRG